MKQFFLFVFLFFSLCGLYAQNIAGNDIRLAYEYYNNKDYDKAEVLFKKIAESSGAEIYFTYYINCLTEQEKFDIAEKEIKKRIRLNRNEPSYYIDLGYLYKRQNRFSEAKKYYDKALKKSLSGTFAVRSAANAFMRHKEYDYAEKVYLSGRKFTGKDYRSELANLYAVQRKYAEMINEYLDLLEESGRNLSSVENRMQYFIDKDINGEFSDILRKELLKRIQKTSSPVVFNKMLIWYYMQRKDFAQALVQSEALDRRTGNFGRQILNLAEIAKLNKDYETAYEAYNYLIKKGRNTPFYVDAETGKLNVSYLKIINEKNISEESAENLEKEYEKVLKTLGLSFNTIQCVIDLAHLKAFYTDKPGEAEKLLNDALKLQGLDKRLAARCEIELGDVLIYENNLESAVLVYAKAELENKGNMFGDSAKLKKAKAAYFMQNFRWAKAQFDALKTSTSKPVANDALYYSLLIEENTEGDSLQGALKLYSAAELFVFRNKKDSALLICDSLLRTYPEHQITDDVYFLKAKIYVSEGKYTEAEKQYKKITAEYGNGILADRALFNAGLLYENELNDKEQAIEYYKRLMIEHPDSIYVTEARRHYRKLRES
ncbi:MAG: tetratricopeptide repeat protein [Chlorobi bacterium]|nr:tetratricopeptide repeat protein [Chlorobiota bacterium]